jgi:hypothetical protein
MGARGAGVMKIRHPQRGAARVPDTWFQTE